jgi:CHAT domain-containing protein
MTWQDVQKQLKPDEAAIEFVHFRLFDKEWTARHLYAALLLRPELEAPAWIPLCEQEQLEEILRITTDDTQLQIENLYSHNGRKFYHAIWNPLKEALRDVKTVYYSPSGLLHKISFSAMPADGEDELLSDQYNLHLVSSTREIARLKKEAGAAFNQDTTIVYGGLVYSLALPDSDRPESGQNAAGLPNAELRGSLSAWEYLAGTKTETEQIVSCLRDRRLPYQYYTEEKGNEESFKHLSGTKAGIIHLATHGFFLPDIERKNEDYAVLRLGENRGKPFENPLLRSGLILSGANRQWLAKENIMRDGIEDGILTADEIAKLNLTKTKLVVLSACETGLGDIKNSEGVFGLQRAFKLAGVESLIMSLWKIPDEATAELMTLFYRQWLSGESKQKAFKTAQKKVREKYPSPFFWAASVLMD